MRRTLLTVAAATSVLLGVAVPYLTSAQAASFVTQNAERTAVVVMEGTQNSAPDSMLGAAGFVQETDSAQAQLILQNLGAGELWSYDPSTSTFQSLASSIPEVGSAIYVRPKTILTIESMVDPSLAAVNRSFASDTPSPYTPGRHRSGFNRLTWSYAPTPSWDSWDPSLTTGLSSSAALAAVNQQAAAVNQQSVDSSSGQQDVTVVGTTTTTTTEPLSTTTTTTTTTTEPPATTTTAPTTTTEPLPSTTTTAPTTTTTSTTSTVPALKPTTTTTSTTVPKKKALSTTTTTTTVPPTTTTTAPPTTTTTAPTTPAGSALTAPPGYNSSELVFNDTAAAPSLNTSEWNTYITSAGAADQPWNSNGEGGSGVAATSPDYNADYDLPGQVSEANGVIDIRATETPTEGMLGGSPSLYPFASGVVSTYGKFEFTGGYVQIEAKMPGGDGMWPGLWMLPGSGATGVTTSDNFEVDIFEGGGLEGSASPDNVYSWHLHYPGGVYGANAVTNTNLTTSFNTYGLNWVPGQSITWYLNGAVIGQVTSAQATIPNEPMELIMNLQVANANTSSWHTVYDSSTPVNSDMLISGVQVYS